MGCSKRPIGISKTRPSNQNHINLARLQNLFSLLGFRNLTNGTYRALDSIGHMLSKRHLVAGAGWNLYAGY
jgi:hypothetical protein